MKCPPGKLIFNLTGFEKIIKTRGGDYDGFSHRGRNWGDLTGVLRKEVLLLTSGHGPP